MTFEEYIMIVQSCIGKRCRVSINRLLDGQLIRRWELTLIGMSEISDNMVRLNYKDGVITESNDGYSDLGPSSDRIDSDEYDTIEIIEDDQ